MASREQARDQRGGAYGYRRAKNERERTGRHDPGALALPAPGQRVDRALVEQAAMQGRCGVSARNATKNPALADQTRRSCMH